MNNVKRLEIHGVIFVTGAAILAIELTASRFMTPMFEPIYLGCNSIRYAYLSVYRL